MPRLFFNPERTLSFDPTRLRALFDAYGAPRSLVRGRAMQNARALAKLLWGADVPSSLADALSLVAWLATSDGRDALVDAARDAREHGHFEDGRIDAALARVRAPIDAWRTMPPSDLALALVAAVAAERAIDAVVERAEITLSRALPPTIPFELVAPPSQRDVGEALLERSLRAIAASDAAAEVDVWALRDGGALVIAVLRETSCDRLRLDARDGRLSIATQRLPLVEPYARAAARALGLDEGAFLARPALTLKPIQAGVERAKLPEPVRGVTLVAVHSNDGRGGRGEARGEHRVAKELARVAKEGGYLSRATLRFAIDGAPHGIDAFIELPNRWSVSDERWTSAVRAALRALGIFEPGAIGDDIATLAPWIHPEWRWRAVVGEDVLAAMRRAKLLARTRGQGSGLRVASEEDARLGAGVRAFALVRSPRDRGKHYAVGADASVRPRTVDGDALAMWKLDQKRVSERMRERMRLSRPPSSAVALPKRVLDVGAVDLEGGGRVRVVRLVRAVLEREREKLARAIRFACGKDPVLVLVPKGRSLGKVLAEVEVDLAQQLGVGDYAGIVADGARRLRVDDELPAEHLVTKDSPLLVTIAREEIALAGVRLDPVLTTNQVALIVALAKAGGRAVHVKELGAAISARAAYPDVVVRKALQDLDARIAKAFEAAGEKVPREWAPLVVAMGRQGYRLGVRCVVR